MSEQDKKNAIPAEGTVEKKEAWYVRLWRNKWVRRITQAVGTVAAIGGTGFGCYKWGFRNGVDKANPMKEVTIDEFADQVQKDIGEPAE